MKTPWFYRKSPVLAALFLFGPFAFWFLWKSPEYPVFWKVTLTLIFSAVMAALLIWTWKAYWFVFEELKAQGLL